MMGWHSLWVGMVCGGLGLVGAARAEEPAPLSICYNYGCRTIAHITLTAKDRTLLARHLASPTPIAERQAIRGAIALMNRIAARTTPIAADRGGNLNDSGDGRMDCIDHSENNTTFLRYFAEQGWLRFHWLSHIEWRAPLLLNLHYTATLRDKQTGKRYAVDDWFFDHGHPAAVIPLATWLNGYSPSND